AARALAGAERHTRLEMTGREALPWNGARGAGLVATEDELWAELRDALRPVVAIEEIDRELVTAEARDQPETGRDVLARQPAAERAREIRVVRPGARGAGKVARDRKGDRGRAALSELLGFRE